MHQRAPGPRLPRLRLPRGCVLLRPSLTAQPPNWVATRCGRPTPCWCPISRWNSPPPSKPKVYVTMQDHVSFVFMYRVQHCICSFLFYSPCDVIAHSVHLHQCLCKAVFVIQGPRLVLSLVLPALHMSRPYLALSASAVL